MDFDKEEEGANGVFNQTAVEPLETPAAINDEERNSMVTVPSSTCKSEEEEKSRSDLIIEEGLYQLGFTADGMSQVYLNLYLKGKDLKDVGFLENYVHIQVLDVSENHLTDLSPLKHLPYLISLNASHNELTSIINSNPPIGLREINFSYNKLEEIGDLSCHSLLSTLLVEHNTIEEIKGIDQCYALSNFSISHNHLTKISGLDGLPIKQLDLSNNYIRKIENLQSLKSLQYINLGYNSIRSLRGLQEHELLEDINLRYNQIIDISEIRYLRDLKLLRILNLDGNPIQELDDYRLSILFRIPALMELDATPVPCEEKVAAVNLFKPSMELTSAADHMGNLVKSYLKPTVLQNSTLSTTDPYPMLIIIGPLGMRKKSLAQKIVQEFPQTFSVCVGHTTRPQSTYLLNGKVESEEDGNSYHFVTESEFEEMKLKGEFLQTCTLFGHLYGISRNSIESVAAKNLACILTMELEGIMSLKRTHFKPRCILLVPQYIQQYKDRLYNTNRYNESEIFESARKVTLYMEMNRIHPGFFDAAIVSDDPEDAYVQLKNIIETYLDISPPNTSEETTRVSEFKSSSPQRMNTAETISYLDYKIDRASASRAMSDSYLRRYNQTKAALMGMTSSFQDQLDKIKTPLSSEPLPFVKGYEDLLKSCTVSKDTAASSYSSDDTELNMEATLELELE